MDTDLIKPDGVKTFIQKINYMHGIKGSYDRSQLATILEPIHQGLLSMYGIPKEINGTFKIGKSRYTICELEEIKDGFNLYYYKTD